MEKSALLGGAVRLVSPASAVITHCTFVGNRAIGTNPAVRGGGAIHNPSGTLQLTACVVAGNTSASGTGPDVWNTGSLAASACVIGNAKDSTITASGANLNKIGDTADPVAHNLAPLAYYGGSSWTMPPLPWIDAINRARTTHFSGDQRGFPINGFPDSGAAEFRGNPDLARYWTTDWDHDGSPFGIEFATDTSPFTPDPADPKNLRIRYESGAPVLTFSLNPNTRPHTRWVIKRSYDLQNFSEPIYSFDGPTSTNSIAPGIFQGSEGGLILVRDNPPNPARAFYRLEAVLSP